MKTLTLSAFALLLTFGATAQAHDIHRTASDHTHPGNVYTHSVSSHYDHHANHHYDNHNSHRRNCSGYNCGRTTTNTATYYTRNYPVTQTYTYNTTPNTTIHQPPYAYSSCAGNCQPSKRIMVSRNLGSRNQTYRAPSEYNANHRYIQTPRKQTNCGTSRNHTYVSPYRTHKLNTCTSFGCNH